MVLSFNSLFLTLKSLENENEECIQGSNLERSEIELFCRLCTATSLEDVDDITNEQLSELFGHISDFSDLVCSTNVFTGKYGDFLQNVSNLPAVYSKRRII